MAVKDELIAAGCPVDLAHELEPRVGAGGRVSGLFDKLALLRKVIALYQQYGDLFRRVFDEASKLIQTGDYGGLIALAGTEGLQVWAALREIMEALGMFQTPAPPAFEAGVSQR